jgi:urease accessory protein
MGAAMLQMHCKLGTKRAKELSTAISKGRLYGHVSVVQGVLWRALNFDSYQAQSMAAHGLSTAVLSAAVRLSVIGHEDAQRIHSVLLPAVAAALQKPVLEPEEAHSFAPQIEIASMMHEMDEMRLFMN